jgi:hypothetical protein
MTSAGPVRALPIKLGTDMPINRSSSLGSLWPYSNRPTILFTTVYEADGSTQASDQHKVLPGQIAKFGFTFHVPASANSGTYREAFRPIIEGYGPMTINGGTYIDIIVP